MLIRIVKLSFEKEKIPRFEALFEATKDRIKSFEGCEKLILYRDRNNDHIFFTYSFWTSESALEAYRNSDFFKEVWAQTKTLFASRAEAWSLQQLHESI